MILEVLFCRAPSFTKRRVYSFIKDILIFRESCFQGYRSGPLVENDLSTIVISSFSRLNKPKCKVRP